MGGGVGRRSGGALSPTQQCLSGKVNSVLTHPDSTWAPGWERVGGTHPEQLRQDHEARARQEPMSHLTDNYWNPKRRWHDHEGPVKAVS